MRGTKLLSANFTHHKKKKGHELIIQLRNIISKFLFKNQARQKEDDTSMKKHFPFRSYSTEIQTMF